MVGLGVPGTKTETLMPFIHVGGLIPLSDKADAAGFLMGRTKTTFEKSGMFFMKGFSLPLE